MWRRMSESRFTLTFDGPDVASGLISVYDLAPSLIAIGDLCTGANRITNGERATLAVKVDAHYRPGSFGIELVLDQSAVEHVRGALFSIAIVGPKEIGEYIRALFALLKALKGHEPRNVERTPNGINITTGDNSVVTINQNVGDLYDNRAIRIAAQRVVAPVEREGIDQVVIEGPGEHRREVVERSEVPYFEPVPIEAQTDGGVVHETEAEALLTVVRPSFEDRLTWTLTDGTNSYSARMEDEQFRESVTRGAVDFAAHDALRVRLHTQTRRLPSGQLRTAYSIPQVLQVVPGPRGHQLSLPMAQNRENED